MRTGSRDSNLAEPHNLLKRPQEIRPFAAGTSRTRAAGLDLANDLLGRSAVSLETAEQCLEVLRQKARAIEVTFWTVTAAAAVCALRVGDHALGHSLPAIPFNTRGTMGERLRRPGVVVCANGEISGVEGLVPAGARSCAVVSCLNDAGIAGLLVLGWERAEPPVDDVTISYLQIAAGALLRTLFGERLAGSRIAAAQEAERSRIARELHDDLGQQAAVLAAKIETLLRTPSTSTANLRDGIVEAQQHVQDLAVSIHQLSHELHPPKVKLLGLVRTLESLCHHVAKGSRVNVMFHSTPVPDGVPEHISLCVCRVAQEALQNAVKHSGAAEVELSLRATESALTLRVSDAGRGFAPSSSAGDGIGLLTMRDRVELNGGRFAIRSSPSHGATIEAWLPYPSPS